jgi:hypothetical protein
LVFAGVGKGEPAGGACDTAILKAKTVIEDWSKACGKCLPRALLTNWQQLGDAMWAEGGDCAAVTRMMQEFLTGRARLV